MRTTIGWTTALLTLAAATLQMAGAPALAADHGGAAGLGRAPPESVGFSSQRLTALGVNMHQLVEAGRYAGMTTLVVRHGKVVNFESHGMQDMEAKRPMQRDTIFRIASMSKPVTGVGLMILYEEGKWQLDDPVSKFLPEFAGMEVMTPDGQLVEPAHQMTMRELVTNTTGLPGGSNTRNPRVQKMYAAADLRSGTLADLVTKVGRLPLGFQPGTEFEYGLNQDVQGRVIEVLSGQTLDAFLRDRIFQPLGMVDTGFGVPAAKRSRLVPVYDYDARGKLVRAEIPRSGEQPAFLSGGGGLFSTAEDYLRFAMMLAGGGEFGGRRILAPSSVLLMRADLLPPGVQPHYASKMLGVGNGVDLRIILNPGLASFNGGPTGVGSYMWTGAYGTWWWNDPANDLIVIGMVQQNDAAQAHVGGPTPAPDLRALTRSLVYAALVEPEK